MRYLADALRVGFLRTAGEEFFVTAKGMEFLDKYQRFSGKAMRVEADVTALRIEAACALDLSFASVRAVFGGFGKR